VTETKTGQRNMQKQQELLTKFGDENPFSPKGIQFLAKRMLGSKYKDILEVALTAMHNGTLQSLVPDSIKTKLRKSFNFKSEIPDAAIVIISTARRAVKGAKGWDEGGVSLLNVQDMPDNLTELDVKTQERLLLNQELRLDQRDASKELMDFLLSHKPKDPPPVVEKPVKKGEVIPFKKTPKPPPVVEAVPEVKKTPLKRKAKKTGDVNDQA